MEIKGKVHCFFEQSGTFKNEFIKLGIPAEDYDIQDNFGQTDHIVDLFDHIERAYDKTRQDKTIFDDITRDDLIVAFFPCIYFSCISSTWFSLTQKNNRSLPLDIIIDNIIERNKNRSMFFEILNKFCAVCLKKNIRMIFENPWSENHFLKFGFLKSPSFVDTNRTLRGDYYVKPTAYWFWNCEPTYGESFQDPKKKNLYFGQNPLKKRVYAAKNAR